MPSAIINNRRTMKGSALVYVPPPITGGLILDLASHVGTFQDAARTTPAILTNDVVGGWADQSGVGNHPSQATAANKPTLQLNQINGYPSVRFDGTNDSLKALFTLNTSFHLWIVSKQISWTINDNIVACGTGDTFSLVQDNVTPKVDVWNGAGSSTPATGWSVGSWCIVEILGKPTTGLLRLNAGTSSTVNMIAGNRGGLTLGSHNNPSGWANAEFARVLLYSAEQNTTDATTIRNALNSTYLVF